MRLLLLNGHGISLRVDGAKLHIRDGRFSPDSIPEEYVFRPKRIDVDNVIIYGRTGNISLDAIRWLIKHYVQISILDWNGKLLTTMLPPESVEVKTKFAQYHSYKDPVLRLEVAKKLIIAKFARTQLVLDWLKQRYPAIDNNFNEELRRFSRTKSISEVMIIEGRIASHYWQQIAKIISEKHDFETREYQKRAWGAGDTVNCILNYGYATLEAECMRAINSTGMDVHVGFMHEMHVGKNSLAYDLQEPFRFLIDLAIINIIENNTMNKNDFIRTENYNLRLRPSGAKKLVNEIQNQFNKKVNYKGQSCTWNYVMLLKTRELAQYLLGKSKTIDFSEPNYEIGRQDNYEIRRQILSIKYSEWKKKGFSKGTLHYMKKNAKSDKPFSLNSHIQKRLECWR